MLQFDHDEVDQTDDATSQKNMSAKEAHNKPDAQYSSLNSSEAISLNANHCSNKLSYTPTSSQVNDNALSDSEQTSNVDDMMCNVSDISHSEMIKYANYSEMLRELGQESKMVLLQYSQVFGDSEAYEQYVSQAITDLTAHGQLLLDTLNDQKKLLCSRINNISEALKREC